MARITRETGTVKAWNGDRGFGFVARPGEPDLFLHVRAFPRGTDEPEVGDRVTFEVEADAAGKLRAARALPAGVRYTPPVRPTPPIIGFLAIAAFIAIYVLVVLFWPPPPVWVLALYVGLSIVAFIYYGLDKSAARDHRRRVAETTLILIGMLGGWPGAIVGQQVFRHKTAKVTFRAVFWVSVLINVFVFTVLNAPGVVDAIVEVF